MDTRATHHLTYDNTILHQARPYTSNASKLLDGGLSIHVTHIGIICLSCDPCDIWLQNLLCVSQLEKNLISFKNLCEYNNVTM